MLDKYRGKIDFILEPMAQRINIKANSMTYLSLFFALFAGTFAYYSYDERMLLLVAAFFVLLNGLLDALDGSIARIRGEDNKKGDFIDHIIDRFSDAFIIGGIVISPWAHKFIGIPAFAMVMLVSYLGTQAQAVGYKRVYAGVLGRADRISFLFFAFIIQFFISGTFFGFYFIELLMIYFIAAGLITIIQRYHAIMKWLG